MNQVVLIGNIATDLEVKSTTGGKAVCRFNLAVNGYNDRTDFVPIEVWNKQAENLVKYQQKGSKIAVVGRIAVDSYESEGQKKTFTKVVAHEVEFLGSKQQEKTVAEVRYEQKQQNDWRMTNGFDQQLDFSSNINISDEDLPF